MPVSKRKSPLEKYLDRPSKYENLTYLAFLLRTNNKTQRTHRIERVLNPYPRYKFEVQPEDFIYIKLILYHPFRKPPRLDSDGKARDLLKQLYEVDGKVFPTFKEVYTKYLEYYSYETDPFGQQAVPSNIDINSDYETIPNDDPKQHELANLRLGKYLLYLGGAIVGLEAKKLKFPVNTLLIYRVR